MSQSGAAKDPEDGTSGEKNMVTSDISEEKMKVHRGERYLHDIQVETIQGKSSSGNNNNNNDDDDDDDDNNNHLIQVSRLFSQARVFLIDWGDRLQIN